MVEKFDYEEVDEMERNSIEKNFFWKERTEYEMDEEVKERLESMGVEKIDLKDLNPRFQREIADSLESMYEDFPEIQGYISCIRSADLKEGTLACTGPRMTEDGYAGAEIMFNRDFFSKKTYGLKIVDMDTEVNWRGERWLAGLGSEGVIDHEIAHVMQLKINAESAGLEIGEKDKDKYSRMQELYGRDATIISLCYDSMLEAGISPKDIGRELSTYGATGFGETFAEAISEVKTRRNPRIYAQTIYDNYRKLTNIEEEVA